MYCSNCGSKMEGNYCPKCGSSNSNTNNINNIEVQDSGSFGWGVLGFFIPLVGLILFLVWKQTKPKSAKAAGIGALISVILNVILIIITFIILGSIVTEPTIYPY